MAFLDLNIRYTESTKRNSTTDKATWCELAFKAMELGYTGVAYNRTAHRSHAAMELGYTSVAYNRTVTRVTPELDRLISLFPLSSVLKLSPSITTAVNLHRRLLNVPTTAPFRQYTRLTVVVDTPAQGSSLNSGNPVLKTYDIVAVRPLKQEAFDLACKNYEVDIIAIDFSENRFRLKQPLIKAAIERGVYFEITYAGLLVDAQLRRQMISNAKLLVDWTRGKNIIFSSAAASVTEFRGPYDVANLASLLGFSTERAKASVSKTCRSLLENSLRKKRFYKEAIRVELISSTDDGFDDWLKWDPISSGEGDLQLDDMAKSFAASSKESKKVKAIDFVSVINELPSHGLQISNMLTETRLNSKLPDPHEKDDLLNLGKCDVLPSSENLEAGETCAMDIEEPEPQTPTLKAHEDIREENVIDEKGSEDICSDIPNREVSITFDDNPHPSNLQCEDVNNFSSGASMFPLVTASNESGILEKVQSDTKAIAVTPVNSYMASSSESLKEVLQDEHTSDTQDVAVTPVSSSCVSSDQDTIEQPAGAQENVSTAPSVVHEPVEAVSMDVDAVVKDDSQMNHISAQESSSGRVQRKHGRSLRTVSFPFRRWLKPSRFKKTLKMRR